MSITDDWVESGLRYAKWGFKTLPLRPEDKIPAGYIPEGHEGYKSAVLADAATLRRWLGASSSGRTNLGMAVGEHHVVIDLDIKEIQGEVVDGESWLLSALERRKLTLPETLTQRSANGGKHLIYALPPDHPPVKNAVGILPGVDIRGYDGYIAVEPSVLKDGKAYKLVNPQASPAELPPELVAALESLRAERRGSGEAGSTGDNPRGKLPISEYVEKVTREGFRLGNRDEAFMYLARDLHWDNYSEWGALDIVEDVWRQTDQSPTDYFSLRQAQQKVTRTYRDKSLGSQHEITEEQYAWARAASKRAQDRNSVFKAEEARQLEAQGIEATGTLADVRITELSQVQPEKVTWLWKNWIPSGKLSLIAGNPEAGKSTLMLELASTLSTGRRWPDGTRPEHPETVLLMTAEDGLSDTVRPRVDAAGGDVSRFKVWEAVVRVDPKTNEPVEQSIVFPEDVGKLRSAILHYNAKVVIIDVLNAYLSGKVDSYRDADIRRVLMPLSKIAEETSAAIIGIVHLNKGSSTSVLNRINGSMGYGGTARVVLLAGSDPEDDTGELRTLIVSKSNIGSKPAGLAYHIISYETPLHSCGKIVWDGESALTEHELLSPPPPGGKFSGGAEWLREQFEASRELPYTVLEAKFQHDVGKSVRTLYRWADELGVNKLKVRVGGATSSTWVYPPYDTAALPAGEIDPTHPLANL